MTNSERLNLMRPPALLASSRTKLVATFAALVAATGAASASDHLDAPTVIADPRADIGDLYAWMSPDARRLNLALVIVGRSLSDRVTYTFHLDSARSVGGRNASIVIACQMSGPQVSCSTGGLTASAREGDEQGGESSDKRLRMFAGQRDDPFFNNVRGTRDAYAAGRAAIDQGAAIDEAGCPRFTGAQSREIHSRWASTDGGAARNFLERWVSTAIVISLDKRLATKGGHLLAAWATTNDKSGPVDRAGRPLTGNALLATFGTAEESNALKEQYNRASPTEGSRFVAEIAKGVALYDGFDGSCGDSFLADRRAPSRERYLPLARLLADDRLWLDSRYGQCAQLFAVERAVSHDCGGRKLDYDAANVWRSLLVTGRTYGVWDGLTLDETRTSDSAFPFLAPPPKDPRN